MQGEPHRMVCSHSEEVELDQGVSRFARWTNEGLTDYGISVTSLDQGDECTH